MKFGRDRLQPPGDWVQTTGLLDVHGIEHRRGDAMAFAKAVRSAEQKRQRYGVRLQPEPTNPHDANAIKVMGQATVQTFFGSLKTREWHIGYVPAEVARELTEDLIKPGLSFSGELYGIYIGDVGGFLDIEFFVLTPKGSPGALRHAKRIAASAQGPEPVLTEEQSENLRLCQMGLYRNTRLNQAEGLRQLGDFAGALDMYLRVAWLDHQGPNNVGTINGEPGAGPPFSAAGVFAAPGIARLIAKGANTLALDIDKLQSQFEICGDREIRAIAPLTPRVETSAAWQILSPDIAAAIATGTHFRAPKQPAA